MWKYIKRIFQTAEDKALAIILNSETLVLVFLKAGGLINVSYFWACLPSGLFAVTAGLLILIMWGWDILSGFVGGD